MRWISFFWGSWKYKRNGSRVKLTWRPSGSLTLHVTRCVHTSMNLRKMKFISYQNVDEKSGISAKIEAGQHLHAVFLLSVEQRRWRHDVADVQSDCRAPWFILTSFKVMWRRAAQCNYWNVNYITFQCFTIGFFSKYTKNVNIEM